MFQNYFRETLSVPLLGPLLFYPPPPPSDPQAQDEYANQLEAFAFQQWYPPPPLPSEHEEGQDQPAIAIEPDEQKVINASLVIRVAGLLVEGQGESKKLNQNALLSCGFTKCLFELALASTAPLSLRAQALNVLTALLRSNRSSQDQLSNLLVSPLMTINTADEHGAEPNYTRLPPRPAILELIGLAVNGPAQGTSSLASLSLRASALSCFEAFVNDNLDARLTILKTMVSSPSEGEAEGSSVGAGKLLLEGVSQFPSSSSRGGKFDPYKYLISALLFAHVIRGSETAKDMARTILFGSDGKVVGEAEVDKVSADEDDDRSTLIQVLIGNFTMALREHGEATRRERGAGSLNKAQVHGSQGSPTDWTRVQVGYLIILSTWFWESKASVEEFLKESSNLQVLIQPVSQGGNAIDAIISGMCAVILGIVYEFGPAGEKEKEDEGIVTRAAMHPILHSRIGPDQFASRLNRLRDDIRFKSTEPDVLESLGGTLPASTSRSNRDAPSNNIMSITEAIPADEHTGIWFDWNFVDFIKSNHVMIQKSILIDPQSTSANHANQSTELLDAKRQFEQMKENYAKSHREIDLLNKKMKEMEENARLEQQRTLQSLEAAMEENEALRESLGRLNESIQTRDQESSAGLEGNRSQIAELELQLRHLQTSHEDKNAKLKEMESSHAKVMEERIELERQLQEAHAKASQIPEVNGIAAASIQKSATDGGEEGEKTKEDLEKELEDLLILLDELSTKRKADKKKMREKGMEVSEDEAEDEDADEDDDVD